MSKVIKVLGVQTHYLGPDGKERLSAVDWWRVINPLKSVAKNNPDIKVDFVKKIVKDGSDIEESYGNIGKKYDILWTSYMDTPKAYSWIKATCHKHGMKHVMDMDDNIFAVDPMNPASLKYYKGSEALRNATIIINDADYITASTKHLADTLAKYRKRTPVVLPNYIDEETYSYDQKDIEKHDGLYIGYQGSSTHYTDFINTGILFVIRRLLKEYDFLKFYVIGMSFNELTKYIPKEKLVIGQGQRDHRKWVKTWKTMPIDIGIAPLINSDFNRSKSSIKYYEYSLRHIPAVYSFAEPYIKVVRENVTGYLAQGEVEWYEKLKVLVEDEKRRRELSVASHDDVLANYTIKDHQNKVADFIRSVYEG
jgi:hypothetical protein